LFEIKTDQNTTTLYQAVGQAMLHGALRRSDPKRILVPPSEASLDTATRLKRRGCEIVRYDWKGNTPIFMKRKRVQFGNVTPI